MRIVVNKKTNLWHCWGFLNKKKCANWIEAKNQLIKAKNLFSSFDRVDWASCRYSLLSAQICYSNTHSSRCDFSPFFFFIFFRPSTVFTSFLIHLADVVHVKTASGLVLHSSFVCRVVVDYVCRLTTAGYVWMPMPQLLHWSTLTCYRFPLTTMRMWVFDDDNEQVKC